MAKENHQNKKKHLSSLTHLGGPTVYPQEYNSELLQAFEVKSQNTDQLIYLNCTEFTSLCPITSQPDFAQIHIQYIPDKKMVESKSLKLYLFSYRNHGSFHEQCVQQICDDLVKLLRPKYLEVIGMFTARGGIAIYPFSQYANKNLIYQNLKRQRLIHFDYRKFGEK